MFIYLVLKSYPKYSIDRGRNIVQNADKLDTKHMLPLFMKHTYRVLKIMLSISLHTNHPGSFSKLSLIIIISGTRCGHGILNTGANTKDMEA